MPWFDETLAFIRTRAPRALMTSEALSRLEALTPLLPDGISAHYLECRLAAGNNQVDVMGCLRGWDGGRKGLRNHLLRSEPLLESPSWKAIDQFCASWSAPGSPLFETIPHVWLAFDLDGAESPNPAPCVLLCLDWHHFDKVPPWPPKVITASQLRLVTGAVFEILLRRRPGNSQTASLMSCRDSLPNGGQLNHMSVMLTRSPQICKLDISLPKVGLHRYLTCIDWPGSLPEVSALVSDFCADLERINFQLVVGESVAPTLELELNFDESTESHERYRLLVDQLCDAGLCATAKRDALREWPGRFRVISPGHTWPTTWTTWTDVKIVHATDRAPFAKGYLGLRSSSSIF